MYRCICIVTYLPWPWKANGSFSLSPHTTIDLFDVSRPLITYSAFQWALCSLSWCMVPKTDIHYRSPAPSIGTEGLLHLFCRLDFSLDSVESNVCLDPKPICQHRLTFSLWSVPTLPDPGGYFPTLHSKSCRAAVSYRKPWCNGYGCWRNMKEMDCREWLGSHAFTTLLLETEY